MITITILKRLLKSIVVILILFVLGTLLLDFSPEVEHDYTSTKNDVVLSNSLSGDDAYSTKLSVSDDGRLTIKRNFKSNNKPDNTNRAWTILVYLCGSDLESEDGCATLDINEMAEATASDDYIYVVQTGGTNSWDNDYISSDSIQRLSISNGKVTVLQELDAQNMGEADTLANFLAWGVENFPATNTGLVLWNHGGGSIYGVCYDEIFDDDSLTLKELDQAFTMASPYVDNKLEFVGFDACLMSSIETANILVPHANYMVASQETESAYGWDYTAIGNYLAEYPNCNGAELGATICDSFYASAEVSDEDYESTLSCVDLSKVDTLMDSLNLFYSDLYDATTDSTTLAEVSRSVSGVLNFGGNNSTEGYTNLIDLGGMISSLSEYSNYSDTVLQSLNDCVVYSRYGEDRQGSTGLSILYPLTSFDDYEYTILKDVCVSPYYMSYIDRLSYANANGGDLNGYSNDVWSIFWNNDDNSQMDYWLESGDSMVLLSEQPYLDDDGYYCFTIDSDSLDYTQTIYCNVMQYIDDTNVYDLGTDDYVYIDWSSGQVTDGFDGMWYSLADGQPLSTYLVEQNDDYNIYSVPVLLNDEYTYLRVQYSYPDGTTKILGAWDGIQDNGLSSRDTYSLQAGDTIVPIYDCYIDQGDYYDYSDYSYGTEYTYKGDGNDVLLGVLPEGDYCYSFIIYDIFGQSTYSDYVIFSVDEDGQVYY